MKTKSKLSGYILRGDATAIFCASAILIAVFSLRGDASTEGSWTTLAPLPAPAFAAAGGVLDAKFYVVSGANTTAVFAYDPASNSWSTRASIPEIRYDATAGVIGGQLYVAGGLSESSPGYLDSLYVYDPLTDTWTTKAPMLVPDAETCGGVIGAKLYVVGGSGPNSVSTNILQVYDSTTDTWALKTPMPTLRTTSAAGVIDGKLYVVGGLTSCCTSLRTLEVYDPVTDSWATKAPLPEGRSQAMAGVINGVLYVAGGINESGTDVTNTLFAYNPATDTWSTMAPMLVARGTAVTGTIDGRLYVAGGGTATGDTALLEMFTPPTPYAAQVEPPIDADGTSVFNANRGVVPVKFTLTQDGTSTCALPPATIAVTRTDGGTVGTVNEWVYSGSADQGSNFRIDSCQYVYNLYSGALGVGRYRVDIIINGQVVGNATFALK